MFVLDSAGRWGARDVRVSRGAGSAETVEVGQREGREKSLGRGASVTLKVGISASLLGRLPRIFSFVP
jgi:hypothetical protein